ncbi:serine hydrolase [Kutzneria kofuensis]|uniref:Dipeptidyl aminopeptidase/acylaminoacyl peptidase n=1 Tax=Kutzneria kofuensis TaxID=103725 RepID=A0A7W9KRL4_9PSEU|nr:serine hydrolase [Kutzneria kofuensis]MBB5897342.1 dipeptidyl aminopeptidase/acylaminoacyl peptidase [Kutzneria kofuensis]
MTRRLEIEDLYDLAVPAQPAMSPDGGRIVYVLRTADRENDRNVTQLWEVGTSGGEARQLTRGTSDSSPAWSPDGATIAFLREDQVWLLDAGEPRPVTTLPFGAGRPAWSPDGTKIAFTAVVGPDESTAPIVVDRLNFKADGVGLIGEQRRHIHVLDVGTGEVRQVTSGDWDAGDPAWSPDGAKIAFCAAQDTDADLTFRSAAYVVEIGGEPRLVGSDEGTCGAAGWTADGGALLVVGRTDTKVGNTRLLRVPVDGGETVDLAESLDRNVMVGEPGYPGAVPQQVGDAVYFCARDRGYTHLFKVEDGAIALVLGGAGTVVSDVDAATGKAAIVLTTPTSYGEIAVVDLDNGGIDIRTAHGANDVELFPHEEREFTISDGTVVHGWLLRDPARTGPLPLLLDIHGGPHNAWNSAAEAVRAYRQVLVARGWAVLLLNPRASDGYGEAFLTGAVGAWGVADAKDFLEPLDQLVAEGVADADRLAVAGYSYGGYMTCYLTSRDDRFAVAVAGGVVADTTSMSGTSDAGHFLAAAELGDADSSPLAKVDQVRTPTLLLHGAADDRCPVGQAEQWFTALRTRGVPTQLVLYPGASHGFIYSGRPSHRVDYNNRVVDWLERRPTIRADHWRRRLAELARKHRVPGAALGILRGDELVRVSAGVLNKATGVPVTDDSVFQIGSITKVWTATLAMQLVDEGRLDLDAPIAAVLPDLRLSDPDVTKRVTLRHLLTHTSGIDGDVFTDTGRGDDCLAKYVDLLDQAAQIHPLGATFSYCNSGFALAGRVIEKLTGKTWDAVLRERLIDPLGLERTVTLPEETILLSAAIGHDVPAGESPRPVSTFMLPRSIGPAGLITASTADLLAFVRLHLTGGLAESGDRLLSETSARAMTELQVELPNKHAKGGSWGLGWMRFDWDGRQVIGHDGATCGQFAFLRIVPELDLAVTVLTNGGNVTDLANDLFRELFAELAGITVPRPIEPPAQPPAVDASPYLGGYERAGIRVDIRQVDDGLRIRTTYSGTLAELMPEPVTEHDLVAVTDTLFLTRADDQGAWIPVVFFTLPTGEQYVQASVRTFRKVD